ncbi:MAG: thiamine pyrophosphate-binding protein [Gemmatimonadota bacterium]
MTRDTAAAVVDALAAAGTPLLTGVPGGGPNLDVVGAAAAAGLPFVLAHGETAAAITAAACADLTGAPGAVVVTRGPGLASAVNGIAHAALDRLPLVVIADSVPAADAARVSHQRLDQAALGRSVAKAVVTVGAARTGGAARHAVRLALAPPAGPVIVTVDTTAPSTRPGRPISPEAGHDLGPLADALARARRPAVLLGTGAFAHTGAVRAALAGSGIPALHTYRARGILPDSGGEAAGLITGGTMEWPVLAAADLIIGLGVDPAEMIPAAWAYQAATLLVTETAAVSAATAGPGGDGSWFTGATGLVAPLPAALALIADRAGRHSWPPGAGRLARERAARALRNAATAGRGLLAPQEVAAAVRAAAPAQAIAAVDAGAHMLAVMPLWEVDEPHRLLISSGLATMGYALPAAIGAALSAPGTPVIAFTGDGGLGMTLMEIETAVRLRLQVIVVVLNDSSLSLIKIKQQPAGHGGPEAVDYTPVSFAGAAAALGAAAQAVTSVPALRGAVAGALRREGPTVIDARVDPAAYPAILDLTRGAAGRRPLL